MDIQNTPKIRTCKLVEEKILSRKQHFNTPKHIQSTMAHFGVGDTTIEERDGQFRGEPVTGRTCTFCNLDEL